jgi:SAM-dependent methyltransferase
MTSEKTGIVAKARKSRYSFLDLGIVFVVLLLIWGSWLYHQNVQSKEQMAQLAETFYQSPLPDVRIAKEARRPDSDVYQREYDFTTDWFSHNIPVWEKVLAPFKGKPDLKYLEIGVYEGRSAVWMLENILTHPTARLTGVDPFDGDFKDRCFANIERSGASEKAKLITGYSQLVIRELPLESYDIIYIDGSHSKDDVLEDAVLSWRLLKEGGILIFDDYRWVECLWDAESDSRTGAPKLAIDPFVQCFDEHFEVIHNSYQLILRKKSESGAPQ